LFIISERSISFDGLGEGASVDRHVLAWPRQSRRTFLGFALRQAAKKTGTKPFVETLEKRVPAAPFVS
jgi:hypothetical protein